ncbi:MAG: NDP-sugar synthase [Ignavibacteria bacterium]
MEEFLGVLFCGGRGTRLGEITKYISKSFIPIYDKPVFKFGLELLERSSLISDIIILTNEMNHDDLSREGYRTLLQDDSKVSDMFTGWEFIKEKTGTKANGILMPSDNIINADIDSMIKSFEKKNCDFLFSLHKINNKIKLSDMGSYNIEKKKFRYKNPDPNPNSDYGVIAPYIIRNNFQFNSDNIIFESDNSEIIFYDGYWTDIGDAESLAEANVHFQKVRQKNK